MARPLRIEYAGALYHVTSRGNRQMNIYENDGDRVLFVEVLISVVAQFKWNCHAYCLMSNHYHLLIETPEGNLCSGMRQLNQVYTQRYNRAHRSVGHMFQGRFKAILVEKESHLLEVCRYVVLNPIRAGMVAHPRQWRWSSYQPTAGLRKSPAWLRTQWVLAQFGKRLKSAQRAYRQFVREGIGEESALHGLRGGFILGSEVFVAQCMSYLESDRSIGEIPQYQLQVERPILTMLFDEEAMSTKALRNAAIIEAHRTYRYTQREIGETVGLSVGMVSRITRMEERVSK